jgi:hypothetical protein
MRNYVAVLLTIGGISVGWGAARLAKPSSLRAQVIHHPCSVATVAGNYGFSSETGGLKGPSIPAVGQMQLGRNGEWHAAYTAIDGGSPVSETLTGKYTIHSDCTGSIQTDLTSGGAAFYVVVDRDDSELRIIGSNPSGYVSAVAAKLSAQE